MAYEMKENSGSLFKNDKRESDTHANAKGSALIDGVEYWVDAWTNVSSSGAKYQSLKFKRKDARSVAPIRGVATQPTPIDLDDEVPF